MPLSTWVVLSSWSFQYWHTNFIVAKNCSASIRLFTWPYVRYLADTAELITRGNQKPFIDGARIISELFQHGRAIRK